MPAAPASSTSPAAGVFAIRTALGGSGAGRVQLLRTVRARFAAMAATRILQKD
jgi:hypothetical protein